MNIEQKRIRFYRPDENSLTIWLDSDGLINIDFGTELVTTENVKWAMKQHRELAPHGKSGVLLTAQSSTRVDSGIREATTNDQAKAQVRGLALLPTATIGWVMAKLYLKMVKTPYPTRVFRSREEARDWLLSLESHT